MHHIKDYFTNSKIIFYFKNTITSYKNEPILTRVSINDSNIGIRNDLLLFGFQTIFIFEVIISDSSREIKSAIYSISYNLATCFLDSFLLDLIFRFMIIRKFLKTGTSLPSHGPAISSISCKYFIFCDKYHVRSATCRVYITFCIVLLFDII